MHRYRDGCQTFQCGIGIYAAGSVLFFCEFVVGCCVHENKNVLVGVGQLRPRSAAFRVIILKLDDFFYVLLSDFLILMTVY